jgi:hypothetical protein
MKLDPVPFLISEFTAANCWSLTLYIGNPTKIIVAQAYRLRFFEYTEWMRFPSVAAGLGTLLTSLVVFWKQISTDIPVVERVDPRSFKRKLTNGYDALFGLVLLLICLACLVGTSFAAIPSTLPFGIFIVMLFKDFALDIGWRGNGGAYKSTGKGTEFVELASMSSPENDHAMPLNAVEGDGDLSNPETNSMLTRRLPTLAGCMQRMPWKIAPFILAMVNCSIELALLMISLCWLKFWMRWAGLD